AGGTRRSARALPRPARGSARPSGTARSATAPRTAPRGPRSPPPAAISPRRTPEQAARSPREDHDDEHPQREPREGRQEHLPERAGDPDGQAGDERTCEAPGSAEDEDDERQHEHADLLADRRAEDGRPQPRGEAGEKAREREDRREQRSGGEP